MTWRSLVAALAIVMLGGWLVQQSLGARPAGPRIDASAMISPGAVVEGDPQTSRVGPDRNALVRDRGPERDDSRTDSRGDGGDAGQGGQRGGVDDTVGGAGRDHDGKNSRDGAKRNHGAGHHVTAVDPPPDPVAHDDGDEMTMTTAGTTAGTTAMMTTMMTTAAATTDVARR